MMHPSLSTRVAPYAPSLSWQVTVLHKLIYNTNIFIGFIAADQGSSDSKWASRLSLAVLGLAGGAAAFSTTALAEQVCQPLQAAVAAVII